VRHTHYFGTLRSKPGFLDSVRSLLSSSPPTIEGATSPPAKVSSKSRYRKWRLLTCIRHDLLRLAFQLELVEKHERIRASTGTKEQSSIGGKDTITGGRVYASKTHKSPRRKASSTSRRRSSTSALIAHPHRNILTTLDIINSDITPSSATPSISGIHLGASSLPDHHLSQHICRG
jgi:hypothetical protein